MSVLRFEMLGDFSLRSETGDLLPISARKSQALLAYLSTRGGQPVSRDKLAGLLWSSTGPDQARQSLRQTLSTLRKDLAQISERKILIEEGDFLSLEGSLVHADTVEFETLVALGTMEAFDRATRLYQGDFLEGFQLDEEKFDLWVTAERDRLHRLSLKTHSQLVEQLSRSGAIDEAIAAGHRSLRIDPLQEPLVRTIMRLYMDSGHLLEALQQYDALTKVLRRELGAEPEAETKAVHDQIVQLRKQRNAATATRGDDRKSVLVVEDNLLNRELTNVLLRSAGYNVILARDGAEALMLIGREHVDLMLLDIDLPFIDGHKVLEALHEKGIVVPTIFVSGLPGEEPEVKAFEIGAADFIRKPVKNSVLLARVARVLK
ncbi:MAG TPA: BTAD domain-containing putative transcriptional regulator [Thermoanaerobaculia bacterium]